MNCHYNEELGCINESTMNSDWTMGYNDPEFARSIIAAAWDRKHTWCINCLLARILEALK